MMYTMPKNLLSICVNFALATQLNTQALHTFNIGLPTRQGHKRVDTCGFPPLAPLNAYITGL